MRGGGGDTFRYSEMVEKAKRSAWRQNKIELEHGTPNPAAGNCSFDSVLYNIRDRQEFPRKEQMSPQEARQVWVTELQTTIETNYPGAIPDTWNGQPVHAAESWDKLKEDGVYEIDLFGDLMLHAISRGCKKVILVFNTSTDAHDPIYVITPEVYGGERDSDIPVCIAYNGFHFESLHPKFQKDVAKTQELVSQYTAKPPTYKYGKKDIAALIMPLENADGQSD